MKRVSNEGPVMNRTGAAIRPDESEALAAYAAELPPSSPGDGRLAGAVRVSYSAEGDLLGHVPPPVAKTRGKKPMSPRATMLLDRMGERLAFERSGARLYEALLARFEAPAPFGPGRSGPARDDVAEICAQEHAHFRLMVEAITEMGGDPTAMTPAADACANASSGLPKVLLDPRATFVQCLDAILVAELTDHDGWGLLADLAEAEGHDELATRFRGAQEVEAEHLASVRGWVSAMTLAPGSARASA